MKATEILSAEHRVIEQVLDCLERMAEHGERSGRIDVESAEKAIDFFRNFADRCHHGKEESHLFPAMEARGFPREGGPTGVMLYEHELGRGRVSAMSEAVAAAQAGDAAAARRFAEHARAYIALLRDHIEKEDHCLFTMADQALDEAEQSRLLEAFSRVESEHVGAGVHDRYLRLADELAAQFQVPTRESSTSGGRCCGH
ncbi:MAG: hemerythrin domain-containing protein [Thermoguttaceae bacterium]|jgi:hemerythrin-like domain-containing protein|nr:hemerythrin domain-containing protein [Thermoguttaceae bacterium]